MRKRVVITMLTIIMSCYPVFADNIGGIEMDVSGGWQFVDSNEGENIISSYYLGEENEYMIITVQDTSFLSDDTKILADLYILNCNDIYGEKTGYYLMTDSFDSIGGYKMRSQECVFSEADQWQYAILGSRSFGDYVVTLIYQAPTLSRHTNILDYFILFDDQLLQ